MKKRMLAVLLSVGMAVSLIGCGAGAEPEPVEEEAEKEPEEEEPEEAEEEPEEEPAEEETEEAEEAEDHGGSLMGYNMIENGDFSDSELLWGTYFNGGYGTVSINADQVMQFDIAKQGDLDYSNQLSYDGFGLEQNCTYEIQFDIWSDVEREVQYRIQINGGDYHPYSIEEIMVGPETQHVDITFTMEEASDPAPRLCFNMGKFENDPELDAHSVYFDNFELYCIDESGRSADAAGADIPSVFVNQIGYKTDAKKIAVLTEDAIADNAYLVDVESGDSVFEGSVDAAKENPNTERKEAVFDFSPVKTEGTYKVVAGNGLESDEFTIGDDVYADAFADALKMLYLQRCGTALDEKYAADFAHAECHADDAVLYGTSTKIDVSGGWHDAGDYGRYVVSGAKAAADIMLAYENYPSAFDDDLGIPESGNGTPDVLDEARYELEWMLKMQADDGGVYHKVTGAVFPGVVMPEEETEQMIVCPVSTTATGDFAAVMAMAARIFEKEDADFAATCLDASKKAAEYLDAHTKMEGAANPSDISTGEYPDSNDKDERMWAYAELLKTTGDKTYAKACEGAYGMTIKPEFGWQSVGGYAAYAYATAKGGDSAFAKKMMNMMASAAKDLSKIAAKDSYACTIDTFVWGSNMTVANNGMLLLLSEADAGLAMQQMDYLFGNNGTGYCFLTGYGTLSPTGTHHRPSQSLGQTMPGMLVGGPNQNLEDPYASTVLKGTAPALCYADSDQAYSLNEICVYWNSPLIYLLAYANQ